ncbi:MAG: regulatory protein RecX [Gemmatimonas sp.]
MSSPSALFAPEGDSLSAAPVTISALRASPRRPGRYAVTLSNGESLVLGIAAFADSGAVRVGIVLDANLLERLLRESTITALADRALGFLARGRRTRRELEQRLRRHEQNSELIAAALDRLEASGLLSDRAVALSEASARLRRGEAPARVKGTLRRKGIADRDASDAVAQAIRDDGFDELAACRIAAEKRMRTLGKLDPAVARRRLTAFLARRGFGGSVLRSIIDEQFRRGGTCKQ